MIYDMRAELQSAVKELELLHPPLKEDKSALQRLYDNSLIIVLQRLSDRISTIEAELRIVEGKGGYRARRDW